MSEYNQVIPCSGHANIEKFISLSSMDSIQFAQYDYRTFESFETVNGRAMHDFAQSRIGPRKTQIADTLSFRDL